MQVPPSAGASRAGRKIFARVNGYLARRGLKVGTGTIVDATILEAPSSTKNKAGERDPEMHQTRKGNEWHFGIHPTNEDLFAGTPV